jgi:hypothetical protein
LILNIFTTHSPKDPILSPFTRSIILEIPSTCSLLNAPLVVCVTRRSNIVYLLPLISLLQIFQHGISVRELFGTKLYPLTRKILCTILWTIVHQEIILVQVFVVRDDQSLPGWFTDLFFQPGPSKPDSFDDNQAQFFLSCYP